MGRARSRQSAARPVSGSPRIEPVGHYAVRLIFDDGHDTGIYSWTYLHQLGREHESRWARYLEDLAKAGLTR